MVPQCGDRGTFQGLGASTIMTKPHGIGAILAGAVVLAAPVVVLFIVFQRYFTSTDIGSSIKG